MSVDCDPPVRHATVAAFTARALAVQLDRLLAVRAASFTRLTLTATNGDGVLLGREWRHQTGFSVDEVTELGCDQLTAWLAGEAATGLYSVSLAPGDIRPWFTLEPEAPRGPRAAIGGPRVAVTTRVSPLAARSPLCPAPAWS